MKSENKQLKQVLSGILNILSAALLAATSFLFTAYAFNYKSLQFIADNYATLIWITAGLNFLLFSLYIVYYLLKKQAAFRLIFCIFVCLDIFAVIFYCICHTGIITKINSIEALRDYIKQFGGMAAVLFIVFQFLQVVALPIPGSVSVAAGVALFGPLYCAIYSFIGIFLGSLVAFAIGRIIGYKAVCWIVGKEDLDKWLNKIKGKDYLILSIMFLLPLFPDDLLCFIAGLSSMSWGYFLVMIAVTRIISVTTTAFSFELIPLNTWWGIVIWAVIVALIVLSFWLVCKYSDKIDKFIKSRFKLQDR